MWSLCREMPEEDHSVEADIEKSKKRNIPESGVFLFFIIHDNRMFTEPSFYCHELFLPDLDHL